MDDQPKLLKDRSFWGLTISQFLGAFNDNLFKQVMLLLAVPVAVAASSKASGKDQQALATIVFSLPYVLFSPFAGYLADKFSKTPIIFWAKVTEILVMLCGGIAFLTYDTTGYVGLLVVLFFMGLQSTFFGPAKYGILPEMLREKDLPRANGIILMTTFLAIILGTAIAGFLKTWVAPDVAATESVVSKTVEVSHAASTASATGLWKASAVCVLIAIFGTMAALLLRRIPASQPALRFRLSGLLLPSGAWPVLKADRPLLLAIFASSVFLVGGGNRHSSSELAGQSATGAIGCVDQFDDGSHRDWDLSRCRDSWQAL